MVKVPEITINDIKRMNEEDEANSVRNTNNDKEKGDAK
jgi:hypothetical protein